MLFFCTKGIPLYTADTETIHVLQLWSINTVNNKKIIVIFCFCFQGLKCGKNKFYWWSAPACPNMCTDPNAEKTCGLPKTESCRCKHGFVLSGDTCVRQNDCGCSRGPNYYPVFFNMS